jgi:chlorite dismutase
MFRSQEEIDGMFVQFVCIQTPRKYTEDEKKEFISSLISEEFFTITYSTDGIRKDCNILIFHMHKEFDKLAKRVSSIMRTSLGIRSSISNIFSGIIRKSQYSSRIPVEDYAIIGNTKRKKYLVVYPFVKTSEWYLTEFEKRKEMMMEHVRVGNKYKEVKQLLAYSFGIDDQEFIVAYETDDLKVFQDLVMELRGTLARKFTLRDTPIITAIYTEPENLL